MKLIAGQPQDSWIWIFNFKQYYENSLDFVVRGIYRYACRIM